MGVNMEHQNSKNHKKVMLPSSTSIKCQYCYV